jgi:hypothetical protein
MDMTPARPVTRTIDKAFFGAGACQAIGGAAGGDLTVGGCCGLRRC